jgi:hypothetical protein
MIWAAAAEEEEEAKNVIKKMKKRERNRIMPPPLLLQWGNSISDPYLQSSKETGRKKTKKKVLHCCRKAFPRFGKAFFWFDLFLLLRPTADSSAAFILPPKKTPIITHNVHVTLSEALDELGLALV